MRTTSIAVACLLHAAAAWAAPVPQCQPEWLPAFGGQPGADQGLVALATADLGSGSALFAGGFFARAGGVDANHVACWDGADWSALGAGTDGTVRALAAFDDGSGPALYAAGDFTTAGGVPATRVARWDGSSWSALGTGLDGRVTALCVFDDGNGDALYAAGNFDHAGGNPASKIAKWDGTSWSPVAGGFDKLSRALCVWDDGSGAALYAAGRFDSAGGVPASKVARWDGASWSALGSGLQGVGTFPPASFQANALCVFDDGNGPDLYVAGAFTAAGGAPASNVARWDGANWTAVGGGISGTTAWVSVDALATHDDGSGTALYAGGVFDVAGGTTAQDVARWNGATWSPVDPDFPIGVLALAEYQDGGGVRVLCAGGTNPSADPADRVLGNVAAWNGSSWQPFTRGLDGPVSKSFVHDDGAGERLFVAGTFSVVGGAPAEHVMCWDGSRWSATGLPFGGVPSAFAEFDDGLGAGSQLFAGSFERIVGSVLERGIARWDGSTWTWVTGFQGQAYAMAAFDDGSGPALYVGGSFLTLPGGLTTNNVARFDGTGWSVVGGGFDGFVRALEVFDDGSGPALYAGGSFGLADGGAAPRVAKWDGSSWASVGGGVTGPNLPGVHALHAFDDGSGPALFATGRFDAAGGQPASAIARWSGSVWSGLGAGLGGPAGGVGWGLLSFDDGSGAALYVAGSFDSAGGAPASNVAKWTGSSWTGLAVGLNGASWNLSAFDDGHGAALFVGGVFGSAPDSGDSFLARWGCDATATTTYCTAGTTSNGCVPAISAVGAPSASAGAGFMLSVVQVEGQRSGLFFYSMHGPAAAPWGSSGTSYVCVKAPVQRMGGLNTGGTGGSCDGLALQDWNAYAAAHPGALGQPFGGGETIWTQMWFRDPPAPKTTNLSDALRFTLMP